MTELTESTASANPFFRDWATPDGVPPFDLVEPGHFREAYARALTKHGAEITTIASDPAAPTFANTIAALESSGRALDQVENVFHVLAGAHTNDALLELERELAPQLARHFNKINTNAALYRRIDALMRGADRSDLNAEQKRVIERYHTGFRRAGAALGATAKQRLAEIIE